MSLAQTPDLKRSIRISSFAAGPVFLHGSLIGAVDPALPLPVFDGGQIEDVYRGARASYDEAILERRCDADLDASELAQDVVLIRALGGGFHS